MNEWLYEILEASPNTVDMIDLTKYLFYKATGNDYGVTEFDFSVFDPKNFKILGNFYGGASNIEGVAGKIYDFLLAKGVPPVGAAAVLGNVQGESSFNPAAINSSSGASGLFQWLGGRLTKLKERAADKGVDWTDVDVQLEHFASEFFDNSYYGHVRDVIMSSTEESELEYATWYFGRHFEVFFVDNSFQNSKHKTAARYKYAKQHYDAYIQGQLETENQENEELE